jgi:outer membrane lipoprotein carrier protein
MAWGFRAAITVVIGLAVGGFVLGAVNTVELAMHTLGKLHGFHASAVVASTQTPAVPAPADDEDEDVPPPPKASPPVTATPPVLPVIEAVAVDAGYDFGRADVGPPARVADLVDASLAPVTPRRAPCNPELAHRVEALYAPVTSFKARFDQELFVRALGSGTRSHGTLLIAKPGKMSWSYDDPEDSRIVSDGETVLVYEAPNKHAFRVPAGSSPYPGAFAFLTGQVPFTLVFDFASRAAEPDMCILSGTPRGLTRAYQRVVFVVDRITLQVVRVVIFDRAGDENRIDLTDPVLDAPIDPGELVFVPPSDTIVVGR